jgi:hypothetical protein
MWALATEWYDGRLEPAWRGRAPGEVGKILGGLGLIDDFWRME